jgi:hypothetical protein
VRSNRSAGSRQVPVAGSGSRQVPVGGSGGRDALVASGISVEGSSWVRVSWWGQPVEGRVRGGTAVVGGLGVFCGEWCVGEVKSVRGQPSGSSRRIGRLSGSSRRTGRLSGSSRLRVSVVRGCRRSGFRGGAAACGRAGSRWDGGGGWSGSVGEWSVGEVKLVGGQPSGSSRRTGRPSGSGRRTGRPSGSGRRTGRPSGSGRWVGRPSGSGRWVGRLSGSSRLRGAGDCGDWLGGLLRGPARRQREQRHRR